jgi:hypothetical protein
LLVPPDAVLGVPPVAVVAPPLLAALPPVDIAPPVATLPLAPPPPVEAFVPPVAPVMSSAPVLVRSSPWAQALNPSAARHVTNSGFHIGRRKRTPALTHRQLHAQKGVSVVYGKLICHVPALETDRSVPPTGSVSVSERRNVVIAL